MWDDEEMMMMRIRFSVGPTLNEKGVKSLGHKETVRVVNDDFLLSW